MACRPTDRHIWYSHSTWAVDEPGALVMADRPVQPGRTWRAGERPDSTVIILTPSWSCSETRRAQHTGPGVDHLISCYSVGPGRQKASHTPTHPHTHVCLCSATPSSSRAGQPRDRADSVPSVHSMLSRHSAVVSASSSRRRQCLAVRLASSYPMVTAHDYCTWDGPRSL